MSGRRASKVAVLALMAVIGAASLSSCGDDDRPCESGHTETILMPIITGKTTVLIPESQFVCDHYAAAPTPGVTP